LKTNILATLTLSTVVATGCVNLEAIIQFSNPQAVLTQSTSSQQTTPERYDGKLEKTSATPKEICEAYNRDHKTGPDEYL
jgi:PBP1b-binding outer membrane lipoprotein LpoB